MRFRVLYLEDTRSVAEKIMHAVRTQKQMNGDKQESIIDIGITWCDCLERIPKDLTCYDLVLTDVYLPEKPPPAEIANRLKEVLDIVGSRSTLRPPPVIAYTAQGADVLEECLEHSDRLYDILDRNLQSDRYIAWRLFMICVELARTHPDSTLIRRIWKMPVKTTPWHGHVRDMVSQYDSAWTESDQVERAGGSALDIAHDLGVRGACEPLWDSLSVWERLGPATVKSERGHARHSLNVFWLGYYLLNNHGLREWFEDAWRRALHQRTIDVTVAAEMDASMALNECWYYASLFHDAACCMERQRPASDSYATTTAPFIGIFDSVPAPSANPVTSLASASLSSLHEVMDPYGDLALDVAMAAAARGEPDHGVVAACALMRALTQEPQSVLAKEAARAIALHTTVSAFGKHGISLQWQVDPVACLLILCDQIQTWDRDDGQYKVSDYDRPRRADLASLRIAGPANRRRVRMLIDYIAPRHLRRDPDALYNVARQLKDAIARNPDRAISSIDGWPFDLHIDFSLSGLPLGVPMVYPRRPQGR